MRPWSGPLPARLRLGTVRPPLHPARGRLAQQVLRAIRNARQIAVHGNCSCSLSPVLDPCQDMSHKDKKLTITAPANTYKIKGVLAVL